MMNKEEAVKEIEDSIHKLENNDSDDREPIGIRLTKAKMDMTIAILQIQNSYGLPAYLTDLILSASLSDIRDCANKDLLELLLKYQNE